MQEEILKFIHISDLHLGKKLKEFSLIEDQNYMLLKTIELIDEHKPDGIIIAGDIYDKSIATIEAINLFSDFLSRLAQKKYPVYITSGNHDSHDRLCFGSSLMKESKIFFAESYNSQDSEVKINPIELQDEFGTLNIYLLPFIRPVEKSYTQAMKEAINRMDLNKDQRNILVAHQMVTGCQTSESEDISVGTLENVDASVFEPFDYVALGHIHKPQKCGSNKVWYSGSPLKYSFSEVNDIKGVNLVEIKEKGDLTVNHLPLVPMRDLHELKGSFEEITSKDFYSKFNLEDFFKIILTDEEDIPEGFGKLQKIYKNILFLDYDNTRTQRLSEINAMENVEKINPLEIFMELYSLQNNVEMSTEQKDYVEAMIKKEWGL